MISACPLAELPNRPSRSVAIGSRQIRARNHGIARSASGSRSYLPSLAGARTVLVILNELTTDDFFDAAL